MTIKFENTNVRFGTEGPFEAESKEALADDMMPTLRDWADDPNATMTADEMRAEFIDGLEAQYHGEPRIIFDNGGNATLQLPGFAHTYDDMEQCAEDIKAWIEDESTSGWDGNEEDAVFEPTMDEIFNGGYQVETLADFMIPGDINLHGANVDNLRVALALNCTEAESYTRQYTDQKQLFAALRNDDRIDEDDDIDNDWKTGTTTITMPDDSRIIVSGDKVIAE